MSQLSKEHSQEKRKEQADHLVCTCLQSISVHFFSFFIIGTQKVAAFTWFSNALLVIRSKTDYAQISVITLPKG